MKFLLLTLMMVSVFVSCGKKKNQSGIQGVQNLQETKDDAPVDSPIEPGLATFVEERELLECSVVVSDDSNQAIMSDPIYLDEYLDQASNLNLDFYSADLKTEEEILTKGGLLGEVPVTSIFFDEKDINGTYKSEREYAEHFRSDREIRYFARFNRETTRFTMFVMMRPLEGAGPSTMSKIQLQDCVSVTKLIEVLVSTI